MHYNFKFAADLPENSVTSMLKTAEDNSGKHYRVNFVYFYQDFKKMLIFLNIKST